MADEDPSLQAGFSEAYAKAVFEDDSLFAEELAEAGGNPVKEAYVRFNYEMNAYPNSA